MKGLFPKYADKTLDDYQILDPSQETALKVVREYIDSSIHMRQTGHGLTFTGPAGVGKTYLAQMVLKAVMDVVNPAYLDRHHREVNYSVESIQADSFISLHQDLMRIDREENYDTYERVRQQIRRIQSAADFVLIDDIGREHAGDTGWANHLIFNLLRYRSVRNLPFLITSNKSLDELAQRYDEGLVSLLHEDTDIIVIKGEDFRCRKGN